MVVGSYGMETVVVVGVVVEVDGLVGVVVWLGSMIVAVVVAVDLFGGLSLSDTRRVTR
jgi:hypothetical protein